MQMTKIEVSIEERFLVQAGELVQKLQIPHNQLPACAGEEFIERYESCQMLAGLNQAYCAGR